MLTPTQLQNLPKNLVDDYNELSEFILRDIARRIAKGAEITETAEYLMYRAKALGLSTDGITAKIAEINDVAADDVEQIIRSAAEKSDEFDRRMLGADRNTGIPLAENEQLQKVMAAEIKQTHGACENYVRTLGFAEQNADGQVIYSSLGDFMIKEMDRAHLNVVNGVTDYNTAIRMCCNKLAKSGVRTVYYNSGHSDRIEVAVRRAVMTSVSQVTQKISEQNAEQLGADGWEISAHAGARPSHAIYQGRQYPNSRYESIVKPLIDDYNCRHSAFPIILGVSEPVYSEEELQHIDPPPITYEGRQYTAYEAQQQMRKMERVMRKQKDRCIAADAMGDKETFTAASIRLRRQKDIYEDFCKAADSYTEYERTTVTGYDRHLSGKTGAVTRKNRAFENAQVRLTDSNDNIISQKLRNNANMSAAGSNDWSKALPTTHTDEELSELHLYAEHKGIKLYSRKRFDGNIDLLKSEIDTIADLRNEYGIESPITVGWKPMKSDDFAETSSNNQEIWFNQLALRDKQLTEKMLSSDSYLATNKVQGIAAHEMGHVISGKIKNGKTGLDIFKETVYNIDNKKLNNQEAVDLLSEIVSEYSAEPIFTKNGTVLYNEIIPEMVSADYTSENIYAKEFVRILKGVCSV